MGFVLCLCYKNNENDVREAFKEKCMPLGWEDFVVKKINWENKDLNIKEISEELSLGLDSFIFIDDSDFEVLRVKESLPEVKVFKFTGGYNDFLEMTVDIVFQKKFLTEEDKAKTKQYLQEYSRKILEKGSDSMEDYIKSLEIQIKIDENSINDLSRVSQLTEKTNQFNFNKIFYSIEDLKQKITSGKFRCYSLRVNDKFGDYGLVGVILVVITREDIILENYILSCRVLGRRIEFDFFDMVKKSIFLKYGREITKIVFKETSKNIPAQNFLKQIKKA
jgi:FkbH-like protein